MLALGRVAVSAAATFTAGAVKIASDTNSAGGNGPLYISIVTGATTILVALIYVFGPALRNWLASKHPAFGATKKEASDALLDELVQREIENRELRNQLGITDDPTAP